jgi:3,4-dihydroxy 2-butanone 4-phosphate synthase/GTP cyclohydrolase II
MVVICDDEDRATDGSLMIAAQFVTSDAINFMAKEGRGLICLALTAERCTQLRLDSMAAEGESTSNAAFTVSVEAREGITTGISAADRTHTIQVAVDPLSAPRDLVRPGHVFPVQATPGGTLERAGQAEAAVDLARLAGLVPAGVICEIMNDDGTMARVDDLVGYCDRHGLRMITVADLIAYRRRNEKLVERVVTTSLPTAFGDFVAVGYRSLVDDKHHVALVKGEVDGREDVLVRTHSECLAGDVFQSLRCDCGEKLDAALAMIAREGAGVLVYLTRDNRGCGLVDKLRTYGQEWHARDSIAARLGVARTDPRDYGVKAQILHDLGLRSVRMLTTDPQDVISMRGYGLRVSEPIPIAPLRKRQGDG